MDIKIGIVVALEEEFEVLKNTFNMDFVGTSHKEIAYITYDSFYITSNGSKLNLTILLLNDMSNTTSASATQWFANKYNFHTLINIGLAGLLSKDYHLLDVIIGEVSYEYDYRGKIIDNQHNDCFAPKHSGRPFNTSKQLYSKLSQLKSLYPTIYDDWVRESHEELMSNVEDSIIQLLKEQKLLSKSEKQVINKGVLYSGGNVGTSKNFKQFLLEQNRLGTAIDMESAGFLFAIDNLTNHPLSLVIKTISDPADERKQFLDAIKSGELRRMAMKNASNFLKIFLDIFDFNEQAFIDNKTITRECNEKDILHDETLKRINSPFKIVFSENILKLWGKILFLVGKQNNINLREEYFLEDLFSFINNSTSSTPLNISGEPGSGISPCLSALYHVFYNNYRMNKTQYYPIYIDFRTFREKIYRDGKDLLIQAKEYAEQEMNKIKSFLKEKKINNILLIYDGIDTASKFQKDIENTLFKAFSSYNNKKIIGIRSLINRQKKIQKAENAANICFQLTNIENKNLDKLIDVFCEIENKNIDRDNLKKILKKCNFNEIDIFLMRLIFNNIDDVLKNNDIHFLFEEFCSDHLDKTKLDGKYSINDIAKFAFDYEINQIDFEEDTLYHNPAWYLFNRNKEIQYFLIATHVINSLKLIATGNDINFSFTYQNRINSYCRYLINRANSTQREVLNGAERVLEMEGKFYAHANALYLLGRLENDVCKEKAIDIIKNYLSNNVKIKIKSKTALNNDNDALLALRTCYISLACLGDNKVSEEYLEKLLLYPVWCNINRGFHLLYYGDKDYDPKTGLIAKDNLENFPKTYSYLYNRINTLIKKPLSDIEIYTFFSLIQHRHEIGRYNDPEKLKEVVDLIDRVLENDIIEYSDLKSYLKVLKDIFCKSNYSHFDLLMQINDLKFEKRKGWVKRNFEVTKIETVASHTLNTVYMASLLLPKNFNEYNEYNKNRILDMLLYHDLAECKTHDHTPEERSEDVKAEEKEFFEKLSLYRTYNFSNVKYIYELWDEFENSNTINALIAKEIDRLEAYSQLLSYLRSGETITHEDFKKWRSEVNNNIQTKLGKRIKRYIENEFKSIIDKYSLNTR
jgi:5'-deoxynucleotidase YfbR-like HD superfamily hydrolase/nucleoside phosphorylase